MKIGRIERRAQKFDTGPYTDPIDRQINHWLLNHDEVVNRTNLQIFGLTPDRCVIMYDEFIEDEKGRCFVD